LLLDYITFNVLVLDNTFQPSERQQRKDYFTGSFVAKLLISLQVVCKFEAGLRQQKSPIQSLDFSPSSSVGPSVLQV
jgi:hypothetical protein